MSGVVLKEYDRIAPGRPYHAALCATAERTRVYGYQVTEHAHDFYEFLLVLRGEAIHTVNGARNAIRSGDLHLLRPGDRHSVRFVTGCHFHYINIALPQSVWHGFVELAMLGDAVGAALREGPALITLEEAALGECTGAFRHALERFQEIDPPSPLLGAEACRLLGTVLPTLIGIRLGRSFAASREALPVTAPDWLMRACQTLRSDPDALREGLPRFVAEAGVTRTHLARVLKASLNQTPTEYVNRLRLERAARLLNTTTLSILDIVYECGFTQISYFYRLFHDRFDVTPHAYRMAAGRAIASDLRPSATGAVPDPSTAAP